MLSRHSPDSAEYPRQLFSFELLRLMPKRKTDDHRKSGRMHSVSTRVLDSGPRVVLRWVTHQQDLWSGRWESNPTPIAWKLLNILRFFSRLWNTLEHNRGYFLDGFAVSIPENVGIDPKSDAGICVP